MSLDQSIQFVLMIVAIAGLFYQIDKQKITAPVSNLMRL